MKLISKSIVKRGLAAMIVAGCCIGPAAASAYDGLYVFGDSLSDVGNIYTLTQSLGSYGVPTEPVSPPYSDGRFSNGNLWVQDVAASLGLGPVTPSLLGGNDFAYGGAQTGTTIANQYNTTLPSVIQQFSDLPSQLLQFKAEVPTPAPNALYTLWIGSNDVNALIDAFATDALAPTDANIVTDFTEAMDNIETFVNGLAGAGMKNLLALNVPDLGKTPDAIAGGSTAVATASGLSALFDEALNITLDGLAQKDGFTLNMVRLLHNSGYELNYATSGMVN